MGDIAAVLDQLTKGLSSGAVLVAGIGALSMAIVEALKALFPVRAMFHRKQIQDWFQGRHRSTDALLMGVGFNGLPSANGPDEAYKQLLKLAIGGESYQTALFEQAPEKMFGEIQAAVSITMDFPDVAPNLYEFLTHDSSDQAVWKTFAPKVSAGQIDRSSDAGKKEYADGNQARQRLDNLVRRRLDALQSRVTYRWSRFNQMVAFALAFAIAAYALYEASGWSLHVVILAAMAGFLAPPAKDLAAALSSIKFR